MLSTEVDGDLERGKHRSTVNSAAGDCSFEESNLDARELDEDSKSAAAGVAFEDSEVGTESTKGSTSL